MAFPDNDLQVKVYAYLGADPTDDPSNWPAPVDLTSRLLDRDISLSLGRSPGQRTAAAGQATIWLNNDDGALTPLLATSPYYPDWDLGVPISVEVHGVGASPPYGLFHGYAASIEVDIVPTAAGPVSAVKVTAGGILRRLGQGKVPRSSARRFFDPAIMARMGRSLPIYYWPMDYGQPLAALQSAPLIGDEPLTLEVPTNESTPDWAGAELAPWLGSGLRLTGAARFLYGGRIITPATPTTIAADVVYRYERQNGGTSAVIFLRFQGVNNFVEPDENTSYGILAFAHPDFLRLELRRINSTLATDTGEAAAIPWDGKPHHLRVVATQNGPDVDVAAYIDGELVISATDPSVTLQKIPRWALNVTNVDMVVAHGALWVDSVEPVSDVVGAIRGHVGETASARSARVCAEEGIPHAAWAPAPSDDVRLGPQPVGTVLDILRDAELAGHGILYERTDTWGLGYRPLESRYNQSAALTIDLSTYRLTGGAGRDVLRPVRNDQRIRNEWTISRPGGSSVTLADADHQARRGRYTDSATINVEADATLPHEAGWRLRETTYDGPRYASLPIDLAANPALLADWLEIRLGDRVDRTGHPAIHPAGPVSLALEGYRTALRRRAWTVELVTEPYAPWDVGVLADDPPSEDDARLAGEPGAATVSDIDEDDTVIEIDPDGWDWGDDDAPFLARLGGEVVRVTAVTDLSGTQELTVERAANDVQKGHAAGTPVEVVRPLVLAL